MCHRHPPDAAFFPMGGGTIRRLRPYFGEGEGGSGSTAEEAALVPTAGGPTIRPRHLRPQHPGSRTVCYREGMRIVTGLILVFAVLVSSAAAQRLPGGVTPEHYALWVAPDIAAATFRGKVDIRVRIEKPTAAITLHPRPMRR